jgi:hypothetical protein
MAAGFMPAASPRKDHYQCTKATRIILEVACSSQSTKSFQLLYPVFFKKTKTKKHCYLAAWAGQ